MTEEDLEHYCAGHQEWAFRERPNGKHFINIDKLTWGHFNNAPQDGNYEFGFFYYAKTNALPEIADLPAIPAEPTIPN